MNDSPERTFSSYLQIIKKRWWLFILLPLITAAVIFIINATSQPEYVAYERLQIIPGSPLQVSLFSRTPTLTTEQQVQSVHDDFYDVIRLPSVAWKTIADLNLNLSAEELIKRIDTQHKSDFITVSARMPSPELAQKVAAVHTQNAIDMFRQIRVNPAQVTLGFLDEQVEVQAQALAQAREALQKFQLEHEVSALPDEIAAAQDIKRSLTAERDRLRTENARAQKLAEVYQKQADENRDKASALRSDLTAALPISNTAVITDTAPVVIPADIANTQQRINALLALAEEQESRAQEQLAIAAGHQAAIADYDRVLDEREQEIIYLLGLQDQYASLLNVVKDAQGSYDYLVDKSNEAKLKVTQGSSVGYLEVVTPASQPNAPVPRNLLQLIAVGVLASLLLGLLLAFILELIERSVDSRT